MKITDKLTTDYIIMYIDIPTDEEIDKLCALIDWISEEYHTLWCMRNFEKGVEQFEGYLRERRDGLSALKTQKI